MRAADRVGRTVVLRLRFDDFTPRHPRAHARRARPPRRARSSTPHAGCSRPRPPLIEERGSRSSASPSATSSTTLPSQLALPSTFDRRGALDAALDEVRDRYGSAAVTRAVLLGRDPGCMVPLLPD